MPVIELKDVNTIYEGEKYPTIRDINLEVEQGEFVCVMGPNGAGKTTLLETINGLLKATSGKVEVLGDIVGENGSKVRTEIGYLVQSFSFDPNKPFLVKDVVMMGRVGKIGLLDFPDESDWEIVEEAMEFTGISEFSEKPIGKLSGGEQQKVMLARVLAQEPRILLLDEPITNLDLAAKSEILSLIEKIYRKKKITILLVTHNVSSIPSETSEILLMDKGMITARDKPEEIIDSEVWESAYGRDVV